MLPPNWWDFFPELRSMKSSNPALSYWKLCHRGNRHPLFLLDIKALQTVHDTLPLEQTKTTKTRKPKNNNYIFIFKLFSQKKIMTSIKGLTSEILQNLNKIHRKLFKLESGNQALMDGWADNNQMGKYSTQTLLCGGV